MQGQMIYGNGEFYTGYWKKNSRHGLGRYTMDRTTYVGSWEDGLVRFFEMISPISLLERPRGLLAHSFFYWKPTFCSIMAMGRWKTKEECMQVTFYTAESMALGL
jgi:hypothetical protein